MGRKEKIEYNIDYLYRPPYSQVLQILVIANKPLKRKEILEWRYPDNYADLDKRGKKVFNFVESRMSQILITLRGEGFVEKNKSRFYIAPNYNFMVRSNIILDLLNYCDRGEVDWKKGVAIFNTPPIQEDKDSELCQRRNMIVEKCLSVLDKSGVIKEIEDLNIRVNLKRIGERLQKILKRKWDKHQKLYTWLYVKDRVNQRFEQIVIEKYSGEFINRENQKEGKGYQTELNRLILKEIDRYSSETEVIFKLPKSLNELKRELEKEVHEHNKKCDPKEKWDIFSALEAKEVSIDKGPERIINDKFKKRLFFRSDFSQRLMMFERPHPYIVLGKFEWE